VAVTVTVSMAVVTVVGISLRGGLSGPLAVVVTISMTVVSMTVTMTVSISKMMTIAVVGISGSLSLRGGISHSNGGKNAQGNNRFHL